MKDTPGSLATRESSESEKANSEVQLLSSSASAPPVQRFYPNPSDNPTQSASPGIRFDFNDGCRILLPEAGQPWRVRLSDLDTGNVIFETRLKAGCVQTTKRYYLRAGIEVWLGDDIALEHAYNASNKSVLINFPVGTIGDSLGWMPYAARFGQVHGCRLTCSMAPPLIELFREAYSEIEFVEAKDVDAKRYYATYNLGLFFDDKANVHQPCDFRLVGLHRTSGYILGVDPKEEPPRITIAGGGRPIAEPYVCIATQATTQAKYWNNPNGWREIIRFLKDAGYRVICIDQKPAHGAGLVWNHIPNGAEDETGDRPLAERARWLKHAEFFIGLASGLSWLAWASGTKVVMISGFSHPTTEFETPYRVINYHACNSCWNDPALRFDHKDFLWCPRLKDKPGQFECTRLITADHVKFVITKMPGFGAHKRL